MVVPLPISDSVTAILPWWYSSTIRRESDNPRPQPRVLVVNVELPPLEGLDAVPVRHGVAREVSVLSETPGAVIVKTSDKDAIEQQAELLEDVEAPVEAGQMLGKVTVRVGESVLCEYNLVAAEGVERMTFGNALKELLCRLIAM